MTIDLAAMPHLAELFGALRSGRHICADDGPLYLALRADYSSYRTLFAAIGFELVEHVKGFYYLRSEAELGKEASQIAVFFFILVDAWGDKNLDIESTAFGVVEHFIADLPHSRLEIYRRCMTEVGVELPAGLQPLVNKLARYGFATVIGEDKFRLRTPAWRFLDLCWEVWQESKQSKRQEEQST